MSELTTKQAASLSHAKNYPGVDVDDFSFEKGSYILRRNPDGQWYKEGVNLDTLEITRNGGGIILNNASQERPLENLRFQDSNGLEFNLQQRIPLIGIGSNSSSYVLSKKFAEAHGAQDIPVFQVKIQNYVVVHSAFLTEEGGVAVTIYPVANGFTHATVGFYTEELVNRLTGTESNYDGVALDARVLFPVEGIVVENPLAYVSAWGAITKNGEMPLGTTHIPGSLTEVISTAEAIKFCRNVTNPEKDIHTFMVDNIKDDLERLRRTSLLQRQFALPAQIKGERVFPAIRHGQEGFPAIKYN